MAMHVEETSNDFIQRIAQEYLTDFTTMKKLAKHYNTSSDTISNLLFKGVAELILDDSTAIHIVNKVTNITDNSQLTDTRWKKALDIRQKNKIILLIQKLEVCKFQLETYDEYFSDEENSPSKADIKASIKELQRELKTLKNT